MFAREGRRHIACWADGRLDAYRVIDPRRVDRTGAIYVGRVTRMDRPLGAAFVQFDGTETGMLPLQSGQRLSEGAGLVVQVLRDRYGEKSARLTRALTFTGRCLQLRVGRPGIETYPQMRPSPQLDAARKTIAQRLPSEHGLVMRPAAETAASPDLEAELDQLLTVARGIATAAADLRTVRALRPAVDPLGLLLRDAPDPRTTTVLCADRKTAELAAAQAEALHLAGMQIESRPVAQWSPSIDELEEALEDATGGEVPIPGGGSLLFEPGQTLTAIDVNAGDAVGRSGGAKDPERARLDLNRAAAAEIARQLRLRNLGGLIVVDFIGLRRHANRRDTVEALRHACLADPQPCQILEMSRFGLVEMMRQSGGPTLAEQLGSGS